MNLLDQLELYTLDDARKETSQKDYWLFVYKKHEEWTPNDEEHGETPAVQTEGARRSSLKKRA